MCRQSPVKPEGILIQIISQVFLRDCPLMCTHQPPFNQRDDKMDMRQQLRGIIFALGNILDKMLIVFFFQRGVTEPPISNNNAIGRDIFLYERDQALGRSVRNYPETYSTKFFSSTSTAITIKVFVSVFRPLASFSTPPIKVSSTSTVSLSRSLPE